MKIIPTGEPWPGIWLPRDQMQLQMTAEQKQIDNYCRDILQILNKATPQNIDTLLEKMTTLDMNSEFNINKLVNYIVQKAVNEPIYSEVYAEMCCSLNQFIDRMTSGPQATENLCGLFKTQILRKCEEEFSQIINGRVMNADNFISRVDDPSTVTDLNFAYRQKMFGIIIFIGQLYKTEFLPQDRLLNAIHQLLEEANVRALEFRVECYCKLMRIIGDRIEHQQDKKVLLDEHFMKLNKICQENEFCSRVKFAVMDLNDMRGNNWVGRQILETPTTIDQIRSSITRTERRKKKKN